MGLPLRLQLRPSRRLLILQLSFHAASLGGVFLLSFPLWSRLLLAAAVALSALRQWRQAGQALPGLRLQGDGTAVLLPPGGDEAPLYLRSALVWPGLVVLRWRVTTEAGQPGPVRAWLLARDSCGSAEEFRQLRVWLRWRARFSGGGGVF